MNPKETLKLSLANGKVTATYSDAHAGLIAKAASVQVRRASHIEPEYFPLRWIFHVLRLFGDDTTVAAWTRTWPCLWRINMHPMGGPILAQRYRSRPAALAEEVKYLESKLF